jgi:hypothetical protein
MTEEQERLTNDQMQEIAMAHASRNWLDDYAESIESVCNAAIASLAKPQPVGGADLLREVREWRLSGTSLPNKIKAKGSIGLWNEWAAALWSRIDATLSAPVAQPGEAPEVTAALLEVGREMVRITTTVQAMDEWPAIPALWLNCMRERDEARAASPVSQAAAVPEAVARAVVYEGLTNDTPPRLIPSPRLHSRLMDLRAALDRLAAPEAGAGGGK